MDTLQTATIRALPILLASMVSVELGLSVAIIEIASASLPENGLGLTTTLWIDYLAIRGPSYSPSSLAPRSNLVVVRRVDRLFL